ncbi:MAG: hypothetical protein GYB35_06125, partial [Algicola sp.]|nr:hypothetical protein [Algicola sp.]
MRNGVSGVDKDFDILFDGFQTIPIGPVNTKIVIGSLEGDQDLSGDRLQIRNVVGNFVDISAPQRSSTNFFNSRITLGNNNFIDRSPASTNTLGFDAAVFELNNGGNFNTIIGNNQTSATLRMTSNQETYGLYLLGLSVDVWAPDLNPIEMTLNSGMNPTNAGDDLGFSFDIRNLGNDNAVNLEITTTLPPQVVYNGSDNLPLGVTPNYDPNTGVLSFSVADGLVNVGSPDLNIDVNLSVQDECYFLEDNCDLSFNVQFVATYNGVLNPNRQTTLSSATLDGCNVGIQDPSTITVNQPAEAIWATPLSDLDRTVDCNDTNALNEAQALEPETDKCNFTYTKNSGSFVEDSNNPSTGTYTNTWTFTDACGRTSSEYVQVITVGVPYDPINIVFNQNNVLCHGESTGSINVNVTGGVPPYTYDWVGPNAFSANTEDLNNLAAGQYTLTVTDSNLCVLSSANLDVTLAEPAPQACEIQVFNCPPIIDIACANSDLGANIVWTPPNFAYECCTSIDGDDYSFFMEFDLPESAFGINCWDFNFAQRVGSDNLRLFQSNGIGSRYDDSYLITPTQYFNNESGTPINIELIDVTATVNWTLQVLNPDDNSIVYTDTVLGITSNGQQTITIPNTIPSGSYKLKFNFDSPDANGGDKIEIDRMYYNASLVDANCSGGINFVVTSTHNPGDLFIPGETTVTYTATYTPATGDPIILTCDFDVTVINIGSTEDLGSHVDPTCSGGSNGSFAVIPNGGTPPYSFSLDNINFGNTSGVFSNLDSGTYTVYVQDSNGCNDPTPIEIVLDVLDTEDPTINAPDDYTIEGCSTNAISDLPYSEVETSITLVQLESALGGNGSSLDDENIKTITYFDIISGNCPITVERTFTVTDDCDNSNSDIQIIIIEDTTAPQLTLPPNSNIECDESTDPSNTGSATAYDICGSTNITFVDTAVTGCGNTQTISRTWTATDECGNSVSDTQTITVEDNTAPVLTVPDDITIECNESTDPADTGNASGSDSCGNVTITFSDAFTEACGNTGTITRTWTATDECGNTASDTQIITIEDTTPPTLTIPSDISVECDRPNPDGNATATDTCGDATITFSDASVSTCGNTEIITRTWTATDECGNSVSLDQTITVVDTTDPVLTVPADATVECTQSTDPSATGTATATDTCGTTTVTFTDSTVAACGNTETITRTWTATDECGNSVSGTQTISVTDTTAPVLTVPADATVECTQSTDPSATGTATATDTCGSTTVTFTDSAVTACGNTETITRTWTATDECGNSVSDTQTITVEDNTAPVLTVPADAIVECTQSTDPSATGTATATDTCGTTTVTFTDSTVAACGNTETITRTWTAT